MKAYKLIPLWNTSSIIDSISTDVFVSSKTFCQLNVSVIHDR